MQDDAVVLTLLAPQTATSKTWIDASGTGSSAPVYWSAGDRIAVNGSVSTPLKIGDAEKVSSASFLLRNVAAPYDVVYPHDAYAGKGEDGTVLLDIPSVQKWTSGTFAEGSALLYGYGAGAEDAVQMKNLCSAIAFTLTSPENIRVNSVTITSLSDIGPICGRFALDPSSLQLSAVGEVGYTVSMTLPEEGLDITPEGTSFYLSIPAGDYPDGFIIRLDDAGKHILRMYWLRSGEGADPGIELGAGKLVVFSPMQYEPEAREICSAEDWEEFAAACNEGSALFSKEWVNKDGTVRIGADFQAATLTKLNELSVSLDGCGHTVTITGAVSPLVNKLGGSIRNLTIAGTNNPSDPGAAGATVFVTTLLGGGLIENCTNKATVVLNNYSGKVVGGAFARTMSGGSIINCTNAGKLDLVTSLESKSNPVLAGGFVGTVSGLTAQATIRGCANRGDITVKIDKPSSNANVAAQAGYGGIVGTIVSGTEDAFLTIESCTNEANISVDYQNDPSTSSYMLSGAGGLVGTAMKYNASSTGNVGGGCTFSWWTRVNVLGDTFPNQDGVYFEMVNCSNKGDVHNGLVSQTSSDDVVKCFTAGIIGIVNGLSAKHSKITGCSSSGKVIPYEGSYSRAGLSSVTGGIAGYAGYADFSGCTVVSTQLGTLKKQAYATSGGIGMALLGFKMENCRVYADLRHIRSTGYSEDNYAIGFGLSTKENAKLGGIRWPMINLEGSAVTGCGFGGSVTYNPTAVAYNAGSGFSTTETTEISQSNLESLIASKSFYVDYFGKGFPAQVTINDNTLWNGQ